MEEIAKEREFCKHPLCGAFDGKHQPLCPVASDEYLANYLRRYYPTFRNAIQRLQAASKRQAELTTFWHGKYEILRRENNVLRRKLTRQEGEARDHDPREKEIKTDDQI